MRRIPVVDPESGEPRATQRGRNAIERDDYIALDDLLRAMTPRRNDGHTRR